jgi:hypothetical protein
MWPSPASLQPITNQDNPQESIESPLPPGFSHRAPSSPPWVLDDVSIQTPTQQPTTEPEPRPKKKPRASRAANPEGTRGKNKGARMTTEDETQLFRIYL